MDELAYLQLAAGQPLERGKETGLAPQVVPDRAKVCSVATVGGFLHDPSQFWSQ